VFAIESNNINNRYGNEKNREALRHTWRSVKRSGGRRCRFFVWVSRSRNFRSTIMKNERGRREK
jgi:hypothetical protein